MSHIQKCSQEKDKNNTFLNIYTIFLSLFCIIYVFTITFVPIPKENLRFADTVLGFFLGTIISTLINYYFGSSRSSDKKTDSLIRNSKTKKIKKDCP